MKLSKKMRLSLPAGRHVVGQFDFPQRSLPKPLCSLRFSLFIYRKGRKEKIRGGRKVEIDPLPAGKSAWSIFTFFALQFLKMLCSQQKKWRFYYDRSYTVRPEGSQ
jgi:hypothetical protein